MILSMEMPDYPGANQKWFLEGPINNKNSDVVFSKEDLEHISDELGDRGFVYTESNKGLSGVVGDILQTSIKEGVLWVKFKFLETPQGKDLLALCLSLANKDNSLYRVELILDCLGRTNETGEIKFVSNPEVFIKFR